MSREIEQEDLTPYLPYALKCNIMGELVDENDVDNPIGKIFTLSGITNQLNLEVNCHVFDEEYYHQPPIFEVFPILRPRSDIDNYSEELFTEFGASFKTRGHFDQHFMSNIKYSAVNSLGYGIVKWLLKNHFDINNLIPEKLAIDINTLK